MKDILDIYVKILVATFGFIGPSFTLLISIFVEALEKARIKHEQQLKTIDTLIRANIVDPDKNIEAEMRKSLAQMTKQKKSIQKELNLLNPRRQIKRVFIPLVMALLFIGTYHFQQTQFCPLSSSLFSKTVPLVLSVSCLIYCFYVLLQILHTVIEAKQDLVKSNTDKIVERAQ